MLALVAHTGISIKVLWLKHLLVNEVDFPPGADGGLDFQCIKVGDEQKLVVQLKNRGKYDIAYK